jgi:hydroxymethylpyrimidine pyrophosphatase-like HAD family hydrolase
LAPRCVYLDLDATLVARGSLFHDADGNVTLLGARALEAALRAGLEIVFMSGRRKESVFAFARLTGQTAYIYEAGAALVLDGEEHWLTGDLVPGERTIYEQMEDAGAPALLLETYAGRLEYHEPWHEGREVSHLFRGLVDAFEADELLERHDMGNLRLVDNGVVHRRSAALADLPQVRAYHLVPVGASKAKAVAAHMQARQYGRDECFAVGDSREDLGVADQVGSFWLVGNALERDPTITEAMAGRDNVRVAEEQFGAGVYEAVVTTLAQARG